MAFTQADTGPYLVVLGMKNATYRVKDAWARAEIEEIEKAIEGGTRFRGVLTPGISGNTITDDETVKNLYVGASPGTLITAANQRDGDIFIYNNGMQNLEFIVANGKYSELGSSGTLGAFAYADLGVGSATVDVAGAMTFDTFTPNVTTGTLSVTYGTGSISVTTTTATASGTYSPAAITIPSSAVSFTPTTGTFTALKDVTYNADTATLTISDGTSDAFWTGATGAVAAKTVTPAPGTISVAYDKAVSASLTALTSASLTGDLSVTGTKPTVTITNPTITVTVSPVQG